MIHFRIAVVGGNDRYPPLIPILSTTLFSACLRSSTAVIYAGILAECPTMSAVGEIYQPKSPYLHPKL